MQKTNFRFEAIVHDDASTDGTATIIREYAEKYPNIIKPILQTENQYSQGKKIGAIMEQLFPQGKYIAECEGDDYWTDPEKLQRQVDFLEAHPDYSTVCNRTKLYSEYRQQYIGENCCYDKSQTIDVRDIILKGGLFISTCSLLYRKSILPTTLPGYWERCHVGDYPLQIHAAMQGKVYYASLSVFIDLVYLDVLLYGFRANERLLINACLSCKIYEIYVDSSYLIFSGFEVI